MNTCQITMIAIPNDVNTHVERIAGMQNVPKDIICTDNFGIITYYDGDVLDNVNDDNVSVPNFAIFRYV